MKEQRKDFIPIFINNLHVHILLIRHAHSFDCDGCAPRISRSQLTFVQEIMGVKKRGKTSRTKQGHYADCLFYMDIDTSTNNQPHH